MLSAQLAHIDLDDLVKSCEATLSSTAPDMLALQGKLTQRNRLDSKTAERIIYEIIVSINRKLFPPLSHLELLLVEGCNMACHYCFESAVLRSRRRRKRFMSTEIIRCAIDLLFDYSAPKGEVEVTLFGGEPTMHFDGMRYATEYLETKSAATGRQHLLGITTNGLLLSEKVIEFVAEHRIKVLLSVDGLALSHDHYRVDRKGVGTFDRVVAALRMLKKRQPWVGVKMTVMPSEARYVFANVQGLYELGANQFLIGHASGVRWPEDAIRSYMGQMGLVRDWYRDQSRVDVRISDFDDTPSKQPVFGCRAARSAIAVNASGEITGCSRIATLNSQESIGKLGDVRFGLYALRNRTEMVNCQRLIENCDAVGVTNGYSAGCFAMNYEECGDLYTPNLREDKMRKNLDLIRI